MVNKGLIKILSIDPALRNFGMAKFDYDVLTDTLYNIHLDIAHTKAFIKRKEYGLKNYRIAEAYHDLKEIRGLYDKLKENLVGVDLVFAEAYIGGRTSPSLKGLVVAFTLLTIIDAPIIFVSPQDAKIVAGTNCRYTAITKKDVIKWAKDKWPDLNWYRRQNQNEHVADALAVACAGLQSEPFFEWYKTNIENN